MEDLSAALADANGDLILLGGGQPALIPEVQEVWGDAINGFLHASETAQKALGTYDPAEGAEEFREAFANLLNKEYGWSLTKRNIAVSSGGQNASFLLMNIFSGPEHPVLLPLIPDYIGYADQLVNGAEYIGVKGVREAHGDNQFKYRLDQKKIEAVEQCGLIALSRPTNPTGNVVTQQELAFLSDFALKQGVPLLVDNAYGDPLPGVNYVEETPFWKPHHIHLYSFSKVGLPGLRTGVVVAHESVIEQFSKATAITSLAPPSFAPAVLTPLIQNGELLKLCKQVILPFYQEKSVATQSELKRVFTAYGLDYQMHLSEGAFFLWLRFPQLTLSSKELYQILKEKGVLVIAGDYFYFGKDIVNEECNIRLNYAMPFDQVQKGIEIIARTLADY